MYGWSNFLGAMQLEENVNPELYWLDPGSGQFDCIFRIGRIPDRLG